MIVNGIAPLLLHLGQDLVLTPLFDELVVLSPLAQGEIGKEEYQDQHADNRNVVGQRENLNELSKCAWVRSSRLVHGIWSSLERLPTEFRDVNMTRCHVATGHIAFFCV